VVAGAQDQQTGLLCIQGREDCCTQREARIAVHKEQRGLLCKRSREDCFTNRVAVQTANPECLSSADLVEREEEEPLTCRVRTTTSQTDFLGRATLLY